MLTLARALARAGARVAIIVYGDSADLPAEVEGVSVIPRRPYRKIRKLVERVPESLRIWRALLQARSRTIVYMAVGSELGVIAVFARVMRRRLVYASASICDFDSTMLMTNRRGVVRRVDLFAYTLGIRLSHAIVVQTEEQVVLCESTFGRRPVLIESIGPTVEREDKPAEAFLWVGRLASYKRPLAYVALARTLSEARFWMVGVPEPHKEDNRLEEAVAKEALEVANLELLPPRAHAELQQLMARAVASVNTGDFEGMPNVLLEAWSKGVPALVLTHDPGKVVETYGLGGFAHGSPEQLVELARVQWATRHDRGLVSQRCREYVETHHDPALVADRWCRVLCSPSTRGRWLPVLREGSAFESARP